MATRNDIKNSKYLTKEDCDPAITVTISECREEDVSMANEPAEMKHILYFREQEKGLILNLTNWDRIEAIAKHPDSDNWGGTVIVLFNDPTVATARLRLLTRTYRLTRTNPTRYPTNGAYHVARSSSSSRTD